VPLYMSSPLGFLESFHIVHQQEHLVSGFSRFFKVFLSFRVSKNHNTCKLIKTWKYLLTELPLKSSLTSIWGSKIIIKEVFLKNSLDVKVLGFRSFFNCLAVKQEGFPLSKLPI